MEESGGAARRALGRAAHVVTSRPALFQRSVAVPSHVVAREVAEEMVLLSLESEEYFGLDPVGTRIWGLLATTGTVQGAFDAMLSEYDVDEARLAGDMEALLTELSSRRLIELVEPPGTP